MAIQSESLSRASQRGGNFEVVVSEEARVDEGDEALGPRVILRHKIIFFACLLAVTIVAIAYAALRAETYTATAAILVGGKIAGPERLISAHGEEATLKEKLQQLLVRRARLDAELNGQSEFVYLLGSESQADAGIQGIVNGEHLLFEAHARSLEESLEQIRQQRSLYLQEVTSLQTQVTLAAEQEASIEEEMKGVRALVERKLAPEPRLLDLERTAAVLAGRKVELETELLKTRQLANQSEQQIVEVQNTNRSTTLTERQEVAAQVLEVTGRLLTARRLLASASTERENMDVNKLANEVEIILSDRIADLVVTNFALAEDPGFAELPTPIAKLTAFLLDKIWSGSNKRDGVDGSNENAPGNALKSRTLATFNQGLTVERIGAGSRIDISFTSPDPTRSAILANAVADTYMQNQFSFNDAGDDGLLLTLSESPPLQAMSAQTLRRAEPPREQDGPSKFMIVVLGVALGGVLGCVAAFLREISVDARARFGERHGVVERP